MSFLLYLIHHLPSPIGLTPFGYAYTISSFSSISYDSLVPIVICLTLYILSSPVYSLSVVTPQLRVSLVYYFPSYCFLIYTSFTLAIPTYNRFVLHGIYSCYLPTETIPTYNTYTYISHVHTVDYISKTL